MVHDTARKKYHFSINQSASQKRFYVYGENGKNIFAPQKPREKRISTEIIDVFNFFSPPFHNP